jgi:hypothetical protein
MSDHVVQPLPDKVGDSDGVHREEGEVSMPLEPHNAHSTARSSVASDGEEAWKAGKKADGREGFYERWVS